MFLKEDDKYCIKKKNDKGTKKIRKKKQEKISK